MTSLKMAIFDMSLFDLNSRMILVIERHAIQGLIDDIASFGFMHILLYA